MIKSLQWLAMHGRETLETAALVFSLFFTAVSFRADTKERRISNLMALAGSHRELWLHAGENPKLARVLKPDPDLKKHPVTAAERRFVHLLITHLAVSHAALRHGVLPGLSGLEKDVCHFFSLPIPREVWTWSREFQDPKFVRFIESCLAPE